MLSQKYKDDQLFQSIRLVKFDLITQQLKNDIQAMISVPTTTCIFITCINRYKQTELINILSLCLTVKSTPVVYLPVYQNLYYIQRKFRPETIFFLFQNLNIILSSLTIDLTHR